MVASIPPNSLVAYKNRPALVTEAGEKIHISVAGGERLRVREKDVELLYPGPCVPGDDPEQGAPEGDVRGAWELLEGSSVSLRELAELVYGEYTAKTAWAAYGLLREGLYFSGSVNALTPRKAPEVAEEEKKRALKQRELLERDSFLGRLKAGTLRLPGDSRFLQDVEALAWGKTDKSRTLKDLGRRETPQEAHRLLLDAGVWSPRVNPHPARFGLSLASSRVLPGPPPGEERLDLTRLDAFAVDSPWSTDPDDALSLEGDVLWVHVADPAVAVTPDSPADLEARGRGATLYLPEGAFRMLAEEALGFYALGLQETSPALSLRITFDGRGAVAGTDIVRSRIRVTRMSYEEADAAVLGTGARYASVLGALSALAERNLSRRQNAGAVSIEFPETHIAVSGDAVTVTPVRPYKSAEMVRECMLLAGEAAAGWAVKNRLPFPYVTQETGDLPGSPLPGLAGSYQIRRCMRPRTLSAKPGSHWGLGLEGYTQVTSPLRRYTDLLAHQQIRAFLTGTPPLTEEEVLFRLAAGEAAASAAVQAERASVNHWLAVYLSGKIGSRWDGVAVDKKGGRAVIIIPALGLETQAAVKKDLEPNEPVQLTLSSVRIPEAEMVFVP
jgi:exoribonuclease-2